METWLEDGNSGYYCEVHDGYDGGFGSNYGNDKNEEGDKDERVMIKSVVTDVKITTITIHIITVIRILNHCFHYHVDL